jgi:hypothetical protein
LEEDLTFAELHQQLALIMSKNEERKASLQPPGAPQQKRSLETVAYDLIIRAIRCHPGENPGTPPGSHSPIGSVFQRLSTFDTRSAI